jgi:hypothetical protein
MNQAEIIDERHKVRLSKNGTKLEKFKLFKVESRVSLNGLSQVNFFSLNRESGRKGCPAGMQGD